MNAQDIATWGEKMQARLNKYLAAHPPTQTYIEEFPLPPDPEEQGNG